MKKKLGFIIALAAFALFLGASYLGYGVLSRDASAGVTRVRVKAPDFTALDANGRNVRLSDMKGKPVVINFWASWCPPCRAEMPHFEEAYNQLGGEVQFMMVNLTAGSETKAIADRYIENGGFTFPIFYDMTGEAAGQYNVRAIPTTVFVDADGNLAGISTGMLNKASLMQGIEMARE